MKTALGLLPVNPQTAAASGKAANNKPKSQQNNSFSDKLNNAVSQSQQATDGKTEKPLLPDLPTSLVIKTVEPVDKQALPGVLDTLRDELTGPDDSAMLPADQLLQTAVNTALAIPGFIPVPTAASEPATPEATVTPVTAPSINPQQQTTVLPVMPENVQPGTLFAETVNNSASQAQMPAELIPTATTPANASLSMPQAQQNLPQPAPSVEDITVIAPTVIAGQGQLPKAETGIRNERPVEAEQQPAEAEVLPLLATDQQGKQASKGFSGEGQNHSSTENPLSQPKLVQDLNINTVEVNKTHTFAQGLDAALTKTDTITATAETKQPGAPFADIHQVAEQIVAQTRLIAKPQNTEMIIKLKPEHLGELTLKVAVENGVVNASFHSNNSEVRNIIEQSLPQLKLDLTNNGLKVDNVSVSAGLDQFLPNHDQDRNSRQQFIKLTNKKDAEGFVEAIDGELAEGRIPGNNSQDGVDYRI